VKKSALKPLVAIAAAGLLLTACAPTGGTAAEVAGVQISEADVDATIENCESVGVPLVDEVNTRGNVVFSMAAGEIARQGEIFGDAQPDPAMVDEMMAASFPADILANPECGEFLTGAMTFNTALQGLQMTMSPEDFTDELTRVVTSFDLNPRYGRVKMQEGGGALVETGSLSTPAGM